jgi:putative drug exporter of the RND superfamily
MNSIQSHRTLMRSPRTPDDPFATTLRRLRWPMLIIWVLAIILLFGLSSSLSRVTNNGQSAYLPSSAQSTKVVLLQQKAAQAITHAGRQPETDAAIVVFATDHGRLTSTDLAEINADRTAVRGLVGRVPGLARPGPIQVSSDGKAAAFTANVTGSTSSMSVDRDAVAAIRSATATSTRSAAGLAAAVTGPAAINADTGTGGNQQAILLVTALIIVAIILLLVYRSPVLWLLPLIGGVGAIVVAEAAAHGLSNAGLTVSELSADILIVLVFGAASDYALLLVHRYRNELGQHETTEAAMAAALRATLPTLLASAGTVACAMLCLLTTESASLHGLGPVGAVGIVAALLAQATLLPALLLVCGRAVFWPRIPRFESAGRDESRIWAGIGRRVARYPVQTTIAGVLLLGAACAGLASLSFDNNPVAAVEGNPGSVVGARLLSEHFPAGTSNPLILLAPTSQASAAAAVARDTPGVGSVIPGQPVEGYSSYSVILSVDPFGSAATNAVKELRYSLTDKAPAALVGGTPAIEYDTAQAATHDDIVVAPLVLVVIVIIIAVLLRAILAPVLLVLTTALSFGASLGLSSLVWHALGFPGVASVLPIYIFIFLVALGVDYNIFLSARIREESRQFGLRDGTLRGLGVTGGVITAAGIVLAATFAALAQIPLSNIAEVGIAVALGVLLDTLFVRTVIVPAILLSIGEGVWWPARRRSQPST